MENNTTNQPKVNAGSMILQKTNEDFNKKTPIPNGPDFKEPIKDPALPVIDDDGEEIPNPETEADVKESSPYIDAPVKGDDKYNAKDEENNEVLLDEE
jgi:hypothetical protein